MENAIKNKYSASMPYPSIQSGPADLTCARILKTALASSKGEQTSVLQYVYQSWIFQEKYPEISEGMRQIAMVEMYHFDLLGKLILSLSGNPSFLFIQDGRSIPWNGRMVRYERTPTGMLQSSLVLERASINLYEKQIKMIQNDMAIEVLKRIVEDERIHEKILEEYLQMILDRRKTGNRLLKETEQSDIISTI